jgi:transposase
MEASSLGERMKSMGSTRKYPPEMRERAVRLVYEWRQARGRTDGGLTEVASQLGVHTESVRNWLNQAERDGGVRPGLTTDERKRLAELERENRELKRANEILKSAAVFFGAELDRRQSK